MRRELHDAWQLTAGKHRRRRVTQLKSAHSAQRRDIARTKKNWIQRSQIQKTWKMQGSAPTANWKVRKPCKKQSHVENRARTGHVLVRERRGAKHASTRAALTERNDRDKNNCHIERDVPAAATHKEAAATQSHGVGTMHWRTLGRITRNIRHEKRGQVIREREHSCCFNATENL